MSDFQLLSKVIGNAEFLNPHYPTKPSSSKTGKASTSAAGCFLFAAADISPVGLDCQVWAASSGSSSVCSASSSSGLLQLCNV